MPLTQSRKLGTQRMETRILRSTRIIPLRHRPPSPSVHTHTASSGCGVDFALAPILPTRAATLVKVAGSFCPVHRPCIIVFFTHGASSLWQSCYCTHTKKVAGRHVSNPPPLPPHVHPTPTSPLFAFPRVSIPYFQRPASPVTIFPWKLFRQLFWRLVAL